MGRIPYKVSADKKHLYVPTETADPSKTSGYLWIYKRHCSSGDTHFETVSNLMDFRPCIMV
jgi:hypothetical protein